MSEKIQYKTRQREEVLAFLKATNGRHVTAAEVCAHFQAQGKSIGTATVYRQLDRLVDEGCVKKYILSDNGSACYQYVDPSECCGPECYHLKCEVCGKLYHMECHEITELEDHLLAHHGFRIDPMRTVFYGTCQTCQRKARTESGKLER